MSDVVTRSVACCLTSRVFCRSLTLLMRNEQNEINIFVLVTDRSIAVLCGQCVGRRKKKANQF